MSDPQESLTITPLPPAAPATRLLTQTEDLIKELPTGVQGAAVATRDDQGVAVSIKGERGRLSGGVVATWFRQQGARVAAFVGWRPK